MGSNKILSPCGTIAAYKRHLKNHETPCAPCRAANADRQREYNAANPGHGYWRNPGRSRERSRAAYRKNREKLREYSRQAEMERRHGLDVREVFSVMWLAQDGLCYLCEERLSMPDAGLAAGKKPHIDHDHRCCPEGRSCAYCRRGIACAACNALIGRAGDDPARLRKIADNLEAALLAVDGRLADKPQQMTLTEE